MIKRRRLLQRIQIALKRSRIVALLGPRQSGKTTVARQIVPQKAENYFDLEEPAHYDRLADPMATLKDLKGVVVIDEIQKRPELFAALRVLADRRPLPARFLILGSSSPHLLKHSSDSLAGRMETIEMGGFSIEELGWRTESRHWLRGGFPLAFLSRSDEGSFVWRKNFIQSVLQKDIPELGMGVTRMTLFRFWSMLAGCHGQIWNAADPARSLSLGETTVRRYLDVLQGVFMVRLLQPWHESIAKRQVKSPKVYFRDSGLFHQLAGIHNKYDLWRYARLGASWEGYVIEQVLSLGWHDDAFFWATHGGAELDLMLMRHGKRIGVEIKHSDSPRWTPSMAIAMKELGLSALYIIYPGEKTFFLKPKVTVINLKHFILQMR